jgi:predicted GNAT family N-acyltransferase
MEEDDLVRFGYVSVGDEFDEEGAPHQRMELRIDTQILRAP